ncbi:uncharacterized protein LOC124819384 [Hydra vulgaris]|uniref:uncharacterized protein LOC124819384 n=1 Tax=Hydra vulgaris TaxID=6087 RepID=UPI001F5EFDF7|nr:uncharacterized protein LOC124819384 [Hydra vulgaris]
MQNMLLRQENKLGRSFWQRWEAEHHSLVLKRQGNIPINRALHCTRGMAESHLDLLAEELIKCEIFTNSKKLEPGVRKGDIDTKRIFNFDETPQFINYGVDGTNSGLAYVARGEPCRKMIRENRESITICPVI